MSQEFMLTELLKLAVNLDYADEIGRRKMFQLVRAMIAHQALPEGLASRCWMYCGSCLTASGI